MTKREKRYWPQTGRNTIRITGGNAANTILEYRASKSTESFETYLSRTCSEKARQNPANQQDLTTIGLDFAETL